MQKIERRCFDSPLEFRSGNKKRDTIIEGYAAVFYDGTPETEFRLFENAYERILPGAFDEVIAKRENVVGLFNHDPSQLLASVNAGTLELSVDERGLKYRMQINEDTPVGQNVAGFVKRGDLSGSSFAFRARKNGDQWIREQSGREVLEQRNLKVFDVGPVTFPAYNATTTFAERSLKQWQSENPKKRNRVKRKLKIAKLR